MTAYEALNAGTNALGSAWFGLIAGLPAAWQIAATAVPLTVFALLVFRFASDQAGITHAKDQIKAHLLELWLYKDDPGVLLRAQGRVVLHSLAYLGYSVVPLALMLVPVALLLVQVEARHAWRPLAPGEGAIVTIAIESQGAVSLRGSGVVVETPALRLDDRGEVLWRVSGAGSGPQQVEFDVAGNTVARRVLVGDGMPPLAPVVYRADDWRTLGSAVEQALPAGSPVASVTVDYPRARGEFIGLSSASWLLFGFTLLLGFALRGVFRVTF
ncbi:MAG: hypothetical protein FJ197_06020 [Gammaproteobacteria bacterium]|nr:hypothetical protein [Gammaproteobacteria bacterium]